MHVLNNLSGTEYEERIHSNSGYVQFDVGSGPTNNNTNVVAVGGKSVYACMYVCIYENMVRSYTSQLKYGVIVMYILHLDLDLK